jgi:hypothetical protein
MNIFAGHNDLVRFEYPLNGRDCDIETAKCLELHKVYAVSKTYVHRCSSSVVLREFPNKEFNTVHFDDHSIDETAAELRAKDYYSKNSY